MTTEGFNLDQLTITDNYLFITVFSDPERCRQLLERVLGFAIGKVILTNGEKTVVPGLGARGIRMDVYAEDEERTVYDIEMQTVELSNLALRSRYYQSTIDQTCIKRGEPFTKLRKSYVIFICTSDPFDADLPRYTYVTCCEETGRLLSDKATRLFVNAAAWAGCTDAHLRALLRYFCEGTIGDDPFVHDVDAAMVEVRSLPEWREARMTFEQYLIQERERVREETERRVREEDAALYVALSAAGRMEEFPQALADEGVHAALLDEFGISVGAQ